MKQSIIPYSPELKEKAKRLRNNSTIGEILLWNKLKGKQMLGYDFHRQKPLFNFIVDFFCRPLMLGIEIDGYSHEFKYEYDKKRQEDLELYGIHIIRFSEQDVRHDMDNVILGIEGWIKQYEKTMTKGFPS